MSRCFFLFLKHNKSFPDWKIHVNIFTEMFFFWCDNKFNLLSFFLQKERRKIFVVVVVSLFPSPRDEEKLPRFTIIQAAMFYFSSRLLDMLSYLSLVRFSPPPFFPVCWILIPYDSRTTLGASKKKKRLGANKWQTLIFASKKNCDCWWSQKKQALNIKVFQRIL